MPTDPRGERRSRHGGPPRGRGDPRPCRSRRGGGRRESPQTTRRVGTSERGLPCTPRRTERRSLRTERRTSGLPRGRSRPRRPNLTESWSRRTTGPPRSIEAEGCTRGAAHSHHGRLACCGPGGDDGPRSGFDVGRADGPRRRGVAIGLGGRDHPTGQPARRSRRRHRQRRRPSGARSARCCTRGTHPRGCEEAAARPSADGSSPRWRASGTPGRADSTHHEASAGHEGTRTTETLTPPWSGPPHEHRAHGADVRSLRRVSRNREAQESIGHGGAATRRRRHGRGCGSRPRGRGGRHAGKRRGGTKRR